jgi:hypothetical protein
MSDLYNKMQSDANDELTKLRDGYEKIKGLINTEIEVEETCIAGEVLAGNVVKEQQYRGVKAGLQVALNIIEANSGEIDSELPRLRKENERMITKEQMEEFKELAKPLVKFINENFDPHTEIIIDNASARITSACGVPIEDYIN